MITSLVLIIGLAAVFGFFLGVYFFLYRINLSPSIRWVAAVLGGIVSAVFMVGVTFLVLWPPLNIMLTLGVLAFAGIMTAVALGGKGKTGKAAVTGTVGACISQDGRNGNEDLDNYGPHLDAGTRP